MNKNSKIISLKEEIKELLGREKPENLIQQLIEKSRHIDIEQRDDFENSLLDLAQKEKNPKIRQSIYETLVSLQFTFKRKPLGKKLVATFLKNFEKGNYPQASKVLEDLGQQVLDLNLYQEVDKTLLVPLASEKSYYLAHFLDKEVIFWDENLKKIHSKKIPCKRRIIYIYPCSNGCIWILADNSDSEQQIFSYSLSQQAFQHEHILIPGELGRFNGITHSHDLMVTYSEHSIYYYDFKKRTWDRWYKTDNSISSVQSIDNNLWVVINNNDLFVFESAGFSGVRKRIRVSENIDKIIGVCVDQRYRAVYGQKDLLLYDRGSTSPFKYFSYTATINQAAIIDDRIIATVHGNGVLEGKDIKEESTVWKIDLGESFEVIFRLGNRIFILIPQTKLLAFEIPDIKHYKRLLSEKQTSIPIPQDENLPGHPVKNLKSFIGREDILKEILDHPKTHILISGNPKIGKTSLLNVIPEWLSANSNCCNINMRSVGYSNKYFDLFLRNFTSNCLNQHLLNYKYDYSENYQGFRAFVADIKRDKRVCVFCLDNFIVPNGEGEFEIHFETFFREIYGHPDIRLLITCNQAQKLEVEDYLKKIKNSTASKREYKLIRLSPYSYIDNISALRSKLGIHGQEIFKLLEFSQGFPHLLDILLHDNHWKEGIQSTALTLARDYPGLIFEYFRDLPPDARLFVTFLLFNDLFGKKIELKTFYSDYPLLREFFPPQKIDSILLAIRDYEKSFDVIDYKNRKNEEVQYFSINMDSTPKLFFLGAKHISETKALNEISLFLNTPNQERAEKVSEAIQQLIGTDFESDIITQSMEAKYKDKFFIRRLTESGQHILNMPLDTYFIIPLQPWTPRHSKQAFANLYISLQAEIKRFNGRENQPDFSQKFYTVLMLFDAHKAQTVKDEIKYLERVSIIGASNMKQILLASNHKDKIRECIFGQLSIEERSPYTTSGAVQDLFYGRELEIALIRGLPENIGIFGTRTIGKTSLLLKLYKDLKSQGNCNVYMIDCGRIEREETLLKNFAEKMKIPFAKINTLDLYRKYISQRAEKEKKQFIFLLDEVDRLVEHDLNNGERIFNTFNKMCTETIESGGFAARFVLVGFHEMYKQMKNPKSRLYNFMVFLPLRALDKKSALALVTKPMENIHVKWKDEAIDANFLVDSCSGHPLLLQQTCHSLLSILDDKTENRGIIERSDIDRAFNSEKFQQIVMRYFHFALTAQKKLSFSQRFKKYKFKAPLPNRDNDEFDKRSIHRLVILTAMMLLRRTENDKNCFSLTEMQAELKKYRINASPNQMREILDYLCLRGVFQLIDEPNVIHNLKKKQIVDVESRIKKIKEQKKFDSETLKIDQPTVFDQDEEIQLKSRYEFGIKIFPRLLISNFDGIENCRKELENLAQKLRKRSIKI